MSGPLSGVKVVEIAGIGPGPFAAMMLADMGADVLRLDRLGGGGLGIGRANLLNRGRPSAAVDLKHPDGRALVMRLAGSADALLEGFRPGVMERLRLGPEPLLEANPRLVKSWRGWVGSKGAAYGSMFALPAPIPAGLPRTQRSW